jgi:hypothetical protein
VKAHRTKNPIAARIPPPPPQASIQFPRLGFVAGKKILGSVVMLLRLGLLLSSAFICSYLWSAADAQFSGTVLTRSLGEPQVVAQAYNAPTYAPPVYTPPVYTPPAAPSPPPPRINPPVYETPQWETPNNYPQQNYPTTYYR